MPRDFSITRSQRALPGKSPDPLRVSARLKALGIPLLPTDDGVASLLRCTEEPKVFQARLKDLLAKLEPHRLGVQRLAAGLGENLARVIQGVLAHRGAGAAGIAAETESVELEQAAAGFILFVDAANRWDLGGEGPLHLAESPVACAAFAKVLEEIPRVPSFVDPDRGAFEIYRRDRGNDLVAAAVRIDPPTAISDSFRRRTLQTVGGERATFEKVGLHLGLPTLYGFVSGRACAWTPEGKAITGGERDRLLPPVIDPPFVRTEGSPKKAR